MTTSEPGGCTARGVEREQFWRRQIEGQAASGLAAREWCLREQLAVASFYAWRRKLAHRDRQRSASEPLAASNRFLPIRLTAPSSVELQLPSGLVIRVPAQETAALRAVLEFVEPRPC
jgi:hypothetical protein